MKKKFFIVCITVFAAMLMTGCCLKHDFEEATCKAPKTCSKCGKIEGEKLEHQWEDATCETPKTCSECGKKKGEPLGHTWEAATCTKPDTCSRCGATTGEALGHIWSENNCVTARECYVCGESDGVKGEHCWYEANCEEPMTCMYCGETEGEPLGHKWVDDDSVIYCTGCYSSVDSYVFDDGVLQWKGATVTLSDEYELDHEPDDYSVCYVTEDNYVSLSVTWNHGKSKEYTIDFWRESVSGRYEVVEENVRYFNDREFYVFTVNYGDNITGYVTVFWREDVLVYIECLTTNGVDPDDYYEAMMDSFTII